MPRIYLQADPISTLLGKLVPSEFRPNRDTSGEGWAGRDDHDLIVRFTGTLSSGLLEEFIFDYNE